MTSFDRYPLATLEGWFEGGRPPAKVLKIVEEERL